MSREVITVMFVAVWPALSSRPAPAQSGGERCQVDGSGATLLTAQTCPLTRSVSLRIFFYLAAVETQEAAAVTE